MKIQMVIDLDIPYYCKKWSKADITQRLHEVVMQGAMLQLMETVIRNIIAQGKFRKKPEQSDLAYYDTWREVLQKGRFDYHEIS